MADAARVARPGVALMSVALTAACLDALPGGRSAQVSRAVLDDSVIVQGPDGYCIDPGASRSSRDEAFVLLASCASILGDASQGAPFAPALITVSVQDPKAELPAAQEQLPRFRAFFLSDAGQAALSLDGDAGDVEVVSAQQADDAFFLHARIAEKGRAAGMGADQWRAVFQVNGRMVSTTVMALQTAPISSDSGNATLRTVVAKIRAASAAPTPG